MNTPYLDYCKIILDKVSFDRQLFQKEYHKALWHLQRHEQAELNQWLEAKGLLTPARTRVTRSENRGHRESLNPMSQI